jgi:hypothetical protein
MVTPHPTCFKKITVTSASGVRHGGHHGHLPLYLPGTTVNLQHQPAPATGIRTAQQKCSAMTSTVRWWLLVIARPQVRVLRRPQPQHCARPRPVGGPAATEMLPQRTRHHGPHADPNTGSSGANRGRSPTRTPVSGIARPEHRCGRWWANVSSRRPPEGLPHRVKGTDSSTVPITSAAPLTQRGRALSDRRDSTRATA